MQQAEAELRRKLVLWRFVSLVLAVTLITVLFVALWILWQAAPEPVVVVEEPEPELRLEVVDFADLPGWGVADSEIERAVEALGVSCGVFDGWQDQREVGSEGIAGTVADWREACAAANEVKRGDSAAAVEFFERSFFPLAIADREDPVGLFTGYFEPTLRGSRVRRPGYDVPLHLRPPELVEVELGRFREDLKGRRIAGSVKGGRLQPFAARGDIDRGALAGRDLELLWVDDAVDAFFLHIQGSGRVELFEGGSVRVGYAGQNGHAYYPIGRELVERGALELEQVSMQSIRLWLEEHGEASIDVMNRNASYVFFRELSGDGPIGSLGAVLVPERSLAVDAAFLPLGAPFWIDTTLPDRATQAAATTETAPTADSKGEEFRRLLVAHDTGGAIRGPVRGDVFWGPGERAAEIAGRMRQEGRFWLLLPRSLEDRY